ncbi:SGNH hydrolase domain-containing protein [Nocardioides plantarum]|uniref:SGNH hydrolase domain-containing protein n=1 Tax=Nocardioides plantarum TaxID=29299 RepID=A0ABV5KD53_9ACTN|nr:SGNH hydrolase domain-containing protein [Nocardioides plantarum]
MRTADLPRLVAALCVVAVVGSGCGGRAPTNGNRTSAASDAPTTSATADRSYPPSASPDAAVPTSAPQVRYDDLEPSPEDAFEDRADLYRDGCQVTMAGESLTGCTYGATVEDATATIAVVGDSKAAQWAPALQELARTRGWRIRLYTKSACAPVAVPLVRDGAEFRSCTTYNRLVDDELARHPVDLVLAGSSADNALVTRELAPGEDRDTVAQDLFVQGEMQAWAGWIAAGSRVAVISDTPKPVVRRQAFDVPTCLREHRDDLAACAFDRAAGIAASGRDVQVRGVRAAGGVDVSPALLGRDVPAGRSADLAWIDPVRLVCPGTTCQPNDGDVLVYRDGSHLSRTYVETLTWRLGRVMTALGLP